MSTSLQEKALIAVQYRNAIAAEAVKYPREVGDASFIPESQMRAIGEEMHKAEVLLWRSDMFELAVDGYESFTGLHYSVVPMPLAPQFWVFDDFSIDLGTIVPSNLLPDGYVSDALLFWPAGFRGAEVPLVIYMFIPEHEERRGRVKMRMLRPDGEKRDGIALQHAAQVWAAHAFTELKLASKEPIVLPRGDRRRLQREHQTVPDVRVIQLRKREESETKENGKREYSSSWVVRGHWRRLHEPRKIDGAVVTFVHAYIKGDGPLLPVRESVFSVSR